MTVDVTRTADHTVAVATLMTQPGDGGIRLPSWLVTSAGAETGLAAAPLYVAPGTSTTWAISATSLPLPSGAATSAKQDTIIGHVDGIEALLTTIDTDTGGIATSAASIDGKITACNTGAVVVSSSALPSGAATSAKQPALGTAGTASSDVITVQGITSMTPLKVDGSGVTQPVSIASVPSHAVTNAGTFAVQVDGTALTKLTDIETNTDSGAVVGNGAAATAQRVTLASDSTGIVALTTSTASIGKLASNTGVTIGAVEIAAAQTLATVTTVSTVTTCSTVTTLSGGGVAHDGVDSGNPVKIGGKAVSTQSGQTAVASADRSDLIQDLDGTVIERPHTHGDMVSGAASTTGTSDTSAVAAQGASTYFYCTGWSIANTGSTATLITFKDGSGGTALGYTVAPASGGSNYSAGGKPLFRTSANTALYFACGSASTTVYVTVYGYKSKV